MTWLTPILAGVAAAVAIPALLILYFLKLRRREVEISTTLLWKKAIEDLRANAPFQRLRNNILLWLQLLALIAALLAIAQPELSSNLAAGERFVILIDRSASMGALDGSETNESRLDQAKREARVFVENLREPGLIRSLGALGGRPASDEAMVIAFDSGAQVVQPFTTNKRTLIAAIDAIGQTDAPTSLDEALRLAGAYSQPAPGAREDESQAASGAGGAGGAGGAPIHLWTDGRIADAEQLRASAEAPITFHAIGSDEARNVAITSIGAERQFDAPANVDVFVGLQGTPASPLDVDVELSIDGVVAAVKGVTLPGMSPEGEPVDTGVVFELTQEAGALLRVRVIPPSGANDEDLLASDNAAHLFLPPAKRASVLLVTPGSLYLQYALEGLNLARLDVMTPAQFRRAESVSEYDAIILDGEQSVANLETLPPGRYLALGAAPPIEGVAIEGEPAPSIVLEYQRDHPILRSAGLDRLTIARARTLALSGTARPLARGERGALIAEVADERADAIVVAFDPAQSDWPFDVGFVIFLAETIQSLARADSGALVGVAPGEAARASLPPGATGVSLLRPDGSTVPLQTSADGLTLFGPLTRAGLYALRWDGPASASDLTVSGRAQRPVTVNLLDPFESDLRVPESLDFATRSVAASASGRDANERRALWPWLILACLGALMVEWWIYNRKVAI
jgi:hypothetical protein